MLSSEDPKEEGVIIPILWTREQRLGWEVNHYLKVTLLLSDSSVAGVGPPKRMLFAP